MKFVRNSRALRNNFLPLKFIIFPYPHQLSVASVSTTTLRWSINSGSKVVSLHWRHVPPPPRTICYFNRIGGATATVCPRWHSHTIIMYKLKSESLSHSPVSSPPIVLVCPSVRPSQRSVVHIPSVVRCTLTSPHLKLFLPLCCGSFVAHIVLL